MTCPLRQVVVLIERIEEQSRNIIKKMHKIYSKVYRKYLLKVLVNIIESLNLTTNSELVGLQLGL